LDTHDNAQMSLLPAPSSQESSIKSLSRSVRAGPQPDPNDDVVVAAAAQQLHVVSRGTAVDNAATSFVLNASVNCYKFSMMEALVART
jgi:hypothetical protein